MDATSLGGICGLDDPDVALWLRLSKFLVVGVEVMKFVWQDIGIRNEVILTAAKSLLHLDIVVAKSIFPGNLIALREVIDLLILVKALILVALARTGAPEEIPLMRVRRGETMLLKHRPAQFIVESDHFEQQL